MDDKFTVGDLKQAISSRLGIPFYDMVLSQNKALVRSVPAAAESTGPQHVQGSKGFCSSLTRTQTNGSTKTWQMTVYASRLQAWSMERW